MAEPDRTNADAERVSDIVAELRACKKALRLIAKESRKGKCDPDKIYALAVARISPEWINR